MAVLFVNFSDDNGVLLKSIYMFLISCRSLTKYLWNFLGFQNTAGTPLLM